MKLLKTGLILIGLVWMGAVGTALFWQFGPSTTIMGFSTRATSQLAGHRKGSLGRERQLMLIEATRQYTQRKSGNSPVAAEDQALAPAPYLNRHLERAGAKWRVRSVEGMDALVYEIS